MSPRDEHRFDNRTRHRPVSNGRLPRVKAIIAARASRGLLQGIEVDMSSWRVQDKGGQGLRLEPVTVRSLDPEDLTWAHLLARHLTPVDVLVLYFPSRFDLNVDTVVRGALETFGKQTGPGTSISFWDPTDPQFSRALAFFDLKSPPALVLARGFGPRRRRTPNRTDIYAITFNDPELLGDLAQLPGLVNSTHELIVRGDPEEIAGYLRRRAADSVLAAIGRLGAGVRDAILKFKPSFQLPGGLALRIG
jgi:hypothetical protein